MTFSEITLPVGKVLVKVRVESYSSGLWHAQVVGQVIEAWAESYELVLTKLSDRLNRLARAA